MHAYWSADLPKEIPRRQQPRSGWAAGLKTEEEERACATTIPALVPGAGAGGGGEEIGGVRNCTWRRSLGRFRHKIFIYSKDSQKK